MDRLEQTTIDGLAVHRSSDPSGSPAADGPAFKLPVRRSLAMHPRLAAWVGGLVLLALIVFAATRGPLYKSESRIYVEPIATPLLETGVGNYDTARYESFLQEQMETVERPDILLAAVKAMPEGVWQQPGESDASAVKRLASALKTERVSTSYQLAISVSASTPEAAAAAATAVTNAYLEAGQKDSKAVAAGRLVLLKEERQRLISEMDAHRVEQASLTASLGVANPSGVGGDAFDTELQTARGELSTARQAHDVAAAQLAALTGPGGRHSAGAVATAEEAVQTDPGISSMRVAINQRRTTLIAQMNGMKPANSLYQTYQGELNELDQQLASMSTGMQAQVEQRTEAKLRQDLQRTADVESRLNDQVSRDTATAASAGPKLQRSAELTADLARLQLRYATVDDAVRSLQLETSGPGMAHLAVAATVPTAPESSKSRIVWFIALPVALLLAVAAALIAQKMDSRIYTAGDLEDVLGFPPVGVLPVPSEVSAGVVQEYLLRLTAGLESAYRGASARSFVFTAASAGSPVEGDIDAVQRKLEELGFSAIVLQAAQIMRVAGDVNGVSGAGHEGYASARLEELKQKFDLLLIHAHPLLHSAEAEYAVRSADGVILAVQSAVTTRREVTQASALLRRLQARGVGTLLQGVTLRNGEPEFRESIAVLEKREVSGIVSRSQPSRNAALIARADFSDFVPAGPESLRTDNMRAEDEPAAAVHQAPRLDWLDETDRASGSEGMDERLEESFSSKAASNEAAASSAAVSGSGFNRSVASEPEVESMHQDVPLQHGMVEQEPERLALQPESFEAEDPLPVELSHAEPAPVLRRELTMFERLLGHVQGEPIVEAVDEPVPARRQEQDMIDSEEKYSFANVEDTPAPAHFDLPETRVDAPEPAWTSSPQHDVAASSEPAPATDLPARRSDSTATDGAELWSPLPPAAPGEHHPSARGTVTPIRKWTERVDEMPQADPAVQDHERRLAQVASIQRGPSRQNQWAESSADLKAFEVAESLAPARRVPAHEVRGPEVRAQEAHAPEAQTPRHAPKAWRVQDDAPLDVALNGTYQARPHTSSSMRASASSRVDRQAAPVTSSRPPNTRQWAVLSRFDPRRDEDTEDQLTAPEYRNR